MRLPAQIRFFQERLHQELLKLAGGDNKERELFKAIVCALESIEKDSFCGIQVPKRLIPKEYLRTYNLRNLWKYNLPNGWRLLYTIQSDEVVVIAIILEWLPHAEYERRFNY